MVETLSQVSNYAMMSMTTYDIQYFIEELNRNPYGVFTRMFLDWWIFAGRVSFLRR